MEAGARAPPVGPRRVSSRAQTPVETAVLIDPQPDELTILLDGAQEASVASVIRQALHTVIRTHPDLAKNVGARSIRSSTQWAPVCPAVCRRAPSARGSKSSSCPGSSAPVASSQIGKTHKPPGPQTRRLLRSRQTVGDKQNCHGRGKKPLYGNQGGNILRVP